jgi:hypothetical protein
MAGTPTTNYTLPTIADGDIIDGVSAINGLATAVDTALKSVADSAGSGVTAGTGITLSGGQVSVDTAWLTSQINAALTAKKASTWGELNTDGFVSGSAE